MDTAKNSINSAAQKDFQYSSRRADADAERRLAVLEAQSLEILNEQALYKSEEERFEALLMKNPLSTRKSLSYFGAMLGLFPPFAIFCRIFFANQSSVKPEAVLLVTLSTIVCCLSGYGFGKTVSRVIENPSSTSWSGMLIRAALAGLFWGITTGGLGGLVFFVFGAIPGAFIAATVGIIGFSAFAVLHRFLKKGDMIEEKHFFPVSLGIALTITAFILGL